MKINIFYYGLTVIVGSALLFFSFDFFNEEKNKNKDNDNDSYCITLNNLSSIRTFLNQKNSNNQKTEDKNIKKINNRPEISDIPLSDDILDYAYKQAKEYDISYTLLLALFKVESNFQVDAISNTNDYGLAQINVNNIEWLSNETGISNADPLNPKHNIKMSTWYLKYLDTYWSNKGFSGKRKEYLMLLSYNRGMVGAMRWVNKNGYSNNYVDSILKAKNKYDSELL